jgi:hypothetical protein
LKNRHELDTIVRKFGFNKDREGLITRFLNEKEHWSSHIKNTKEFILESSQNKSSGICMVLGSGWWLDIPVEELHSKFELLIFVDVTHPPQIIRKAVSYPKIVLISMDLTGVLHAISECKNFSDEVFFQQLNNDRVSTFIDRIHPDFVVSSNILSQLSFFPKRYVSGRTRHALIPEILEQSIEENHLKVLIPNKSCLITDYHQIEYGGLDEITNESPRIKIQLPLELIKKEWVWDFDLDGNYINNRRVRFKVAALQV